MSKVINDKKLLMMKALRKQQTAKELAATTGLNANTIRAYLITLIKSGDIEEINTYPKTYKLLGKLPVVPGITAPEVRKISEQNVNSLVELLSSDKDAQNPVLKLTQELLRKFKDGGGNTSEIYAAAKLYIELGYALNRIAENQND